MTTKHSKMNRLFEGFFPPRVKIFTSDRTVDFSLDSDQNNLSLDQRDYLLTHCDIIEPQIKSVRQVHGNKIALVDDLNKDKGHVIAEADGLVTNAEKVALAVRTADCLPIFIYDQDKEAIGIVHAGWRGSKERIAHKALEAFKSFFHSNAKDCLVAFGPSIRSCCYEVDAEFSEFFPNEIIGVEQRYFLDLVKVNKNQLLSSGVKEANIVDCQICTHCDSTYFSYRREGKACKRMISFIILENE